MKYLMFQLVGNAASAELSSESRQAAADEFSNVKMLRRVKTEQPIHWKR